MADQFLDVISFRKGASGKSRPHKIGYAKPDGKGGYYVDLDSLPLPDDKGRVSIRISPRMEKGAQTRRPSSAAREMARDLDEDIPF